MSYDVAKPNFLDWSKKKSDLTLPLCQFNLPDLGDGDGDGDADAEPLKLGPKAEYAYKIKLDLPAKYTAHAPVSYTHLDVYKRQVIIRSRSTTPTINPARSYSPSG